MPPASLEMLVTTLVTEAMISLGQIPHPHTGEVMFQPQQAKYLIDMIDMLREKTKGNVTPDETRADGTTAPPAADGLRATHRRTAGRHDRNAVIWLTANG